MQGQRLDQQTGPLRSKYKSVYEGYIGCDPQYIQVCRNMLLGGKPHPVTYQYLSVNHQHITSLRLIHFIHTSTVEFIVTLYS